MRIVLYLKNDLDERIESVLSLCFEIRSYLIRQLIDSRMTFGSSFQKIFHPSVLIGLALLYHAPSARSILSAQTNSYPWSRFSGMNVQYVAGQLITLVLRYSCQRKESEE